MKYSKCILEVVLECNIEVKGITSVCEANAYERTVACERTDHSRSVGGRGGVEKTLNHYDDHF